MDYSPRGLKPNYLQPNAREQLMDCPSGTRNDFSTHDIQEDVMLHVCSNFLEDVEQIKLELAILRQEMRNLQTELQEDRVNCMAGNFRPWAPSQKENQKTVRLCNFCHKNGHTPNWCRKNARRRNTESARRYVLQQGHCSHTGIRNK